MTTASVHKAFQRNAFQFSAFQIDKLPGSIGGGLAVGKFTRSAWNRLRRKWELEEEARLALLAAEKAALLAAQLAAEAERLAAIELARRLEDETNVARSRQQAVIDALAAITGAQHLTKAFQRNPAFDAAVLRSRQLQALQQEEDAVIPTLLLHNTTPEPKDNLAHLETTMLHAVEVAHSVAAAEAAAEHNRLAAEDEMNKQDELRHQKLADSLEDMVKTLGEVTKVIGQSHQTLMHAITAPRKTTLHRDAKGKATHGVSKIDI